MNGTVWSKLHLAFLALLVIPARAGAGPDQPSAKEQRLRIDRPPSSIVFATAFSPDGQLLAVACFDKTVIIYDVATGGQRRFAVRNQATKNLEALGDAAESVMQKTLKGNPTLEVRRRLEQLLQKLPVGPKQLRMLRATETLEQIGSADARKVPEHLAKGMPDTRFTLEAKASLERMNDKDAKARSRTK